MSVRIKEILKTDSLAGSRIVINNNFKNTKNEIDSIDKFFVFDEDSNRIAIKTPEGSYVETDEAITKKITGNDLKIYNNSLLCIDFDEDGDLLIRENNNCKLNVREAIAKAASKDVNIDGISNDVKTAILNNTSYITSLTNKLAGNSAFVSLLINRILSNSVFNQYLIDLIQKYAPVQQAEECKEFSVYNKLGKLYLHCTKYSTNEYDILLEEYFPKKGDIIKFEKPSLKNVINKYYGNTEEGDDFVLKYTNIEKEEITINKDGTYNDYNENGEVESIITCEGIGTEAESYTIQIL